MKAANAKVPESLWYVPQLEDISNVHPRLIELSEKLRNLSPDILVSRAIALLEAALMLESINFDLMKAIVDTLDDATKDAYGPDVRDFYSLAIDILVDIPVGQFLDDPTEPLPPIELIDENECTAPDCDCITWGCCGKELEAENLAIQTYQCPSECPECGTPQDGIAKVEDWFASPVTGHVWLCAVCYHYIGTAPAPVNLPTAKTEEFPELQEGES